MALVLPVLVILNARVVAAAPTPTVAILSPTEGAALRLDEPTTLAAALPDENRGASTHAAVFAWDLVRVSDGRGFALTPDLGSGPMSGSNRSLLVTFGSLPDITEGEFWLSVRARLAGAPDTPADSMRKAIRIMLARNAVALAGVAPGVVVAGEENVVLHGAGLLTTAELSLLGSFVEGGCPSCPRPVDEVRYRMGTPCRAAFASDGRTVRFVVPISQAPGTYQVAIRQGSVIIGGPVLRVVPRAITRPVNRDPHRVAWPLVSGQTIEGKFQSSSDPTGTFWDYNLYYFYSTAGSRLTIFLRRVDTSKSWLHPDELDPEIAVSTPDHYVPYYLNGTDDQPNGDMNASITRAPLLSTGLYFVLAATTKGTGPYQLGFQLERVPPLAGESRFVFGTGLARLVPHGEAAVADVFLFDRLGAPLSGTSVLVRPGTEVPAVEFTDGLTARTSPWGFVTVRMRLQAPGYGGFPALWFAAEQNDARYASSMYGHDRKSISVHVRINPMYWTSFGDVVSLDQATGELQLGAITFKRDPYARR